jgi:O-antigen/teichoic acid export membrane protein
MLKQKIILNFLTKFVLQFIQIVASIIVARIAGPTVLGTVAFGSAYVTTFFFISDLGLGGAHIKLISEGRDEGKCMATYTLLKTFTTIFFVIVVIVFFLSQKYLYNVSFDSKIHQYIIFIFLIATTIQSLIQIPIVTFAAKIEIAKHTIPNVASKLIYHILRIVVVLLGYKALTLAFSNLFSIIIIIPIVLFFSKELSFSSYDKELARQYLKIAFPLIISSITISFMAALDKVFLQFFTNSEHVGYYTAGYRFGSLLLIVVGSIGIFFPIFSKAIMERNENYIRDIINKWERFVFIFVMPTVIFVCIYSDSIILFLLGEKYILSITVMPFVTLAMFIRVWTTPYGNVLTGGGLFVLVAKLEVLILIVFIATLVLFIHPQILGFKATGAALSLMITNIFSGIVFIYLAKNKLNILKKVNNFKFILFGVINFILFFFLYSYLTDYWGIAFRIAFPVIYFTATYYCLFLMKWIKNDDLRRLISLIDVKTMKKYLNDELKVKNNIV